VEVVVVNLVLTVVQADLVVVAADLHIVIHQEQLADLHSSRQKQEHDQATQIHK
jgi:hypothetical protein